MTYLTSALCEDEKRSDNVDQSSSTLREAEQFTMPSEARNKSSASDEADMSLQVQQPSFTPSDDQHTPEDLQNLSLVPSETRTTSGVLAASEAQQASTEARQSPSTPEHTVQRSPADEQKSPPSQSEETLHFGEAHSSSSIPTNEQPLSETEESAEQSPTLSPTDEQAPPTAPIKTASSDEPSFSDDPTDTPLQKGSFSTLSQAQSPLSECQQFPTKDDNLPEPASPTAPDERRVASTAGKSLSIDCRHTWIANALDASHSFSPSRRLG